MAFFCLAVVFSMCLHMAFTSSFFSFSNIISNLLTTLPDGITHSNLLTMVGDPLD